MLVMEKVPREIAILKSLGRRAERVGGLFSRSRRESAAPSRCA